MDVQAGGSVEHLTIQIEFRGCRKDTFLKQVFGKRVLKRRISGIGKREGLC